MSSPNNQSKTQNIENDLEGIRKEGIDIRDNKNFSGNLGTGTKQSVTSGYINTANATLAQEAADVKTKAKILHSQTYEYLLEFTTTPATVDSLVLKDAANNTVDPVEVGGKSYRVIAGTYSYTVTKAGYANKVGTVVLTDNTDVAVTLNELFTITPALTPNTATLVIEDSNGNTMTAEEDETYELIAGTYTYACSATGYAPLTSQTLTVTADATLTVALTELFTITPAVTPEGATLVVKDSNSVTVTAEEDGTYELAAGSYTYTCSAEDYTTVTDQAFTVTEDATLTITLEEVTP